MADPKTAPNQSSQASDKVKAEGDRDTVRTGRGELDELETRDVVAETLEKQRKGEDIGASGISNRPLAEEKQKQQELPKRHTRKAGGGA